MTRNAPVEIGRHSIRIRGYDYTQAGAYYVTIVSSGREYLFGEVVESKMVLNRFGQIAKAQWERLPRRFRHVVMSEFVVMPNHIHGIIIIVDGRGTAELSEDSDDESTRRAPTVEQFGKPISGSIPTIIRSYKSAVALRVNLIRQVRGIPVWQRNYYEHIIRNQTDYERIAGYILDNPVNWNKDDENPAREGNAPAQHRIHRSGH